jgi:hypothetical protein
MCGELNEELDEGQKLATALVDHLSRMGNASSALIPVVDRAEEYVVIIMPKDSYEKRQWPINENPK